MGDPTQGDSKDALKAAQKADTPNAPNPSAGVQGTPNAVPEGSSPTGDENPNAPAKGKSGSTEKKK
jgi:hypothetical protein